MIDDQPTWVSITKSRVKKLLGGQAEEVPSTQGRLALEESIRALVQQPNPVDVLFVDGHLDECLGELANGEAVVAFAKEAGALPVVFDQGALGAPTQKTTQLLCSSGMHMPVLERFGPMIATARPDDPALHGGALENGSFASARNCVMPLPPSSSVVTSAVRFLPARRSP